MSIALADKVRAVDGVTAVAPTVVMMLDDQMSGASMGIPPMITGEVAGSDQGHETFQVRAAQGAC